MRKAWAIGWITALGLILWPQASKATDFSANPDNYVDILASLQAGDTLKLAAGNYNEGLDLVDLNGHDQAWFRIEGPLEGSPAVILSLATQSSIRIKNCSYVQLFGLTLQGEAGRSHHAIELTEDADYAHHILIEELHITGFNQTADQAAIITEATAWDWIIRRNHIEDVGTGLQLGNGDESSPFIRGTIEQNAILQPLAYAISIGAQSKRPSTTGVPQQSATTFIRHNVLSKSHLSRMNVTARPLLRLESQATSGFAERDDYQVYGNVFYENVFPGQALLLAEGNLRVHNNILVNALGTAIEVRSLTASVRELDIFNNTIIAKDYGIKIEDVTLAFEQTVVGNAIFANTPIVNPQGESQNKLDKRPGSADDFLRSPQSFDYFPKESALAGSHLDLEYFASMRDYDLDFNGVKRNGNTRGAYHDNGENTGWRIHLGRKNRDILIAGDAGLSDATSIDVGRQDAATWIDGGAINTMTDASGQDANSPSSACSCHNTETDNAMASKSLWLLLALVFIRARKVERFTAL